MSQAEKGDQSFGAAAEEKQEEADAVAAKGQDPEGELSEGPGQDPAHSAGGKASDGAPSDAG